MTRPSDKDKDHVQIELNRQRGKLLHQVDRVLDGPMTFLAFVWLVLLILDFTRGLGDWESVLSNAIWGIFLLHFAVEFVIAPHKLRYLRSHWLTAVALVLPAVRVFRALRVVRLLRFTRVARSLGFVRLVTSLNRAMAATRRVAGRYGIVYVFTLTALVTFSGAAGMYLFENPQALGEAGFGQLSREGAGLRSYGDALWWTAMIVTTMGSEYWPKTAEGRLLAWFLAVYAFAIFGYITATIASLLVGQEQKAQQQAEGRSPKNEIATLRAEVRALAELLRERQSPSSRAGPSSGEHG